MLRRPAQVSIVTVVLALIFGAFPRPSAAITGNYVEDFEHPFVGLVVFYDESGEFLHRCSGSLLTPRIFLTAGHCTAESDDGTPTTARVYFQQDAGANFDPETELDPITGYPETCAGDTLGETCATSDELYDYDFEGLTIPETRDLGLVILDQEIELAEYGALAGAGTLDGLATRRGQQDLTFTDSGYGLTETNPVHTVSFRERLMAKATLVNLRSALTDGFNLQTTNNPGDERGGTCGGDSGGPVFRGGFSSNLIVAVTSFGQNEWCKGVDFAYRVDTEAALAWIQATVAKSSAADEAGKIVIVDPETPSQAAPAPGEKPKAKHKKQGKAKGEQRKGGKAKGHRHR